MLFATRRQALLLILLIALPFAVLLSICTGPVAVGLTDVVSLVQHRLGLGGDGVGEQTQLIVESIRLPRALLGVLVGSALAASGAAMQGLFRNPLADPGIVGVSSGAAMGAGIAIVLGQMLLGGTTLAFLLPVSVSLLAFLGGAATTWIVYKIGTDRLGTSVSTMLLGGVAVSALSGSVLGVLTYAADATTLRNLTFWQMGSLGGASWQSLLLCLVVTVPVVLLLCRQGVVLNAMLLGESEARHLGVNVEQTKLTLVLLTSLAVGVSVSLAGIIGFVGLVVPHLIRTLAGPDHTTLLPASALLGATLLLVADTLARTVMAPAELPIGIVTALMGAPFFISLLWRRRHGLDQ